MSEEHEHRRRPRGGRWLLVCGWVAAALLAGNLVWGKLNADGGRPRGFVSEPVVRWATFWLPAGAIIAACLLGIHWTTKVHARREKSSLVWTRWAFVSGLVTAGLLTTLVMRAERTNTEETRRIVICVLAAAVAVNLGLFAYAAFREYRRTIGGGRRGGGSDGE